MSSTIPFAAWKLAALVLLGVSPKKYFEGGGVLCDLSRGVVLVGLVRLLRMGILLLVGLKVCCWLLCLEPLTEAGVGVWAGGEVGLVTVLLGRLLTGIRLPLPVLDFLADAYS